jgi:outer membrane receptor protein involved in Fe transport
MTPAQQTQADPLGNAIHQVFSKRELYTAEETHIFNSSIVNTVRGAVSRIIGLINAHVSGDAVATDASLAIAPGAAAPPQIGVTGLTTACGLNGFNKFNHAWNSFQFYDDAFITRGSQAIKVGFAFERMEYNILEMANPNGRMNTYPSLAAFLSNTPEQLNAVAPNGSHEVGLRESLFAGYFQDDWKASKKLTLNLGLRYEATSKPTNSNILPAYTVNGYTVAAAPFQIIQHSGCVQFGD